MYKPEWLSEAAEVLWKQWEQTRDPYDVLIVGSGYGGAVAAARLAPLAEGSRPLTICVLERGLEYVPGTFPNNFSELPGHVRFSRFDDAGAKGARDGLFDLRIGKDVSVLVANGLGGGSLINAGVAVEPLPDTFDDRWPAALRRDANGNVPLAKYAEDAQKDLGARAADTDKVSKHAQFVQFTQGLSPDKAKITVDESCVKCGDCATGCNVGAKVTLSKNYLRKAKEHGAAIFTGVTVSHVEKRAGEWAVFVAMTNENHPLQKEKLREIRARTVILAAGTLGSTEILMRSKAKGRNLALSKCLGKQFSTNGDMINAVYNRAVRVNASAIESDALKGRDVGATITGIARDDGRRIVVEELAIPGALRRVFEEVLTTTVMLDQFGRRDTKPHPVRSRQDPAFGGSADSGQLDPAAVDRNVVEGCQLFAAMGDDCAKGKLELVPGWDDPEHRGKDGAIRVDWPEAGKEDVFKRQDKLFCERAKNGWTYLASPLWQPLPAGLSKALSGAKPAGMLFSVHPLGGCPMADDVAHGVVDHMGRVFDPEAKFHDGLLVLDGSIVPTALGVNPLLTITALAERAMKLYAVERKWVPNNRSPKNVGVPPPVASRQAAVSSTGLQFAERMAGKLSFSADGSKRGDAELTLRFDPIPDVADFLRQPLHELTVNGTLQAEGGNPAKVTGNVQLLVRGASGSEKRIVGALWSYWRARGPADFFGYVSAWACDLLNWRLKTTPRDETTPREGRFKAVWKSVKAVVTALVQSVKAVVTALAMCRARALVIAVLDSVPFTRRYVDLASNVGEVRYLFYEFTLEAALLDSAKAELLPGNTVLTGRKTLKYIAGRNPWRQLTDLDVVCDRKDGTSSFAAGTLTVDPAYFFNGFASRLQITKQRDLPAAWMDLASLALFIARIFLKIHFWSFRLPDYQKYDPMRDVRRLPGRLKGLNMERHLVGYPATPRDAGVFLPVTRYYTGRDNVFPVLLIHGLGSGGIQFATDRVSPNLVQCLANWGFDVWVAELRTSIALPYSADQWTLDEVARKDIPRIVDFVLDKTGARQTNVVAHCIGSAMFCTAVLDGRLQHTTGESKIRSAVLLQVGPLITLSKGTRLRTLAAGPLVRMMPNGHLDFSVDDRAGWLESTIDRLLNTYPYPADEAKHHRLQWWGWHNRHIANCNRWAAIDGLMIRHENLDKKMLTRLGEVLGHANITTWAQTIQYGQLERLTDSEARNCYVTADNVREYFRFPVRFLHGRHNDVFDPLTSWRSQELLQRVHGKNFPAEVQILPGYRHLDPLIGKNTESQVFPYVAGFLLRDHQAWVNAPQEQEEHYYFRRPLIGPVLGYLRPNAAGAWVARIWCRIDDLRSPAAFVLVAVIEGRRLVRCKRVACPTPQAPNGPIEEVSVGPIDTTMCVDIELSERGHIYEVVVLTAHDAIADPVSKQVAKAEARAGKPQSAPAPHLSVKRDGVSLMQALSDFDEIQELRRKAKAGRTDEDEKIDCATVTIPQKKNDSFTFALASCRYPGWAFDRERADAMFQGIAKAAPAPSALFLVGDQIYADATAGAFDAKDRRERFYEAYREAWTAKNARTVLSKLPTYMMMDDHETSNDWHPEDVIDKEDAAMRKEAVRAFRQYQWLHGPGNSGQPLAQPPERDAYFYKFELEGFPFFVCEARTRREGRTAVLDKPQFDALTNWLDRCTTDYGDRPKFVVSSSVVVPFLEDNERATRSDGWDGYVDQLGELFKFISTRPIKNVVFLCGDSHLSNCSLIEFSEAGRPVANAFCIVASALYAPYPFANATRREFLEENCSGTADASDWRKPLLLPNGRVMKYRVIDTSWVEKDNFALVAVTEDRIEVKIGETGRATFELQTTRPACVPQPAPAPSPMTVAAK